MEDLLISDQTKKQLKQVFFKKFLSGVIFFSLLLAVEFFLMIWGFLRLRQGQELWITILLCILLVLTMIIVSIVLLVPYLKDLRLLKRGQIKVLCSPVLRFRRAEDDSGDVTTVSCNPILFDSVDQREVELKIKGLTPDKIYQVAYLPHTRIGIAVESNRSSVNSPVKPRQAPERLVEKKRGLKKRFYRAFTISLLTSIPLSVGLILASVFLWKTYAQGEIWLVSPLLVTAMTVFDLILCCRILLPFFEDLSDCRSGRFSQMTGKVIRYREKTDQVFTEDQTIAEQGKGISPIISTDHPVVRNIQTGAQFKMTLPDTCLNGIYHILYLKHTKIGVIMEQVP